MLFNINTGHTLTGGDTGAQANGYKEENLTRSLGIELEKELKLRGHNTRMCRVDHASTLQESLNKQVALCNAVNADLNICLHFNKCAGGYGSEIYTYGGKYLVEADRVLKELNKLGFRNRGIKDQSLALTKRTKAKTIYIEVCFIDSTQDVATLNKYGMSGIAKAIANGVLNENKPLIEEIKKEEEFDVDKVISYYGDADVFSAVILSQKLGCAVIREQDLERVKAKEVIKVGGPNSSVTKGNRFDTFKGVSNLL